MKKWKILIVSLFILIFAAGCQDKEDEELRPADVLEQYVKLWNEQKFDEMYEMLSETVRAEVGKEDFVDRYQKIYGDLGVTDLNVQVVETESEDEEQKDSEELVESVSLPFSVSMNTLAGPVEFEQEAVLTRVLEGEEGKEEVNWTIEWNTGFIFEKLQPEDRVRLSFVDAERGEIVDRNGNGLAVNGEVYVAGLVPEKMAGQEEEVKRQFSEVMGVSVEAIDRALGANWVQPHLFVPIKKYSMDNHELTERLLQINGVLINRTSSRVYPYGEAAAHLIGYVDEVTAEDLEKNEGYSAGDVIGKRGLEQLFEERLKGENGVKIYIEKPDGVTIPIAEKPVQNGETIKLTIDAELQKEIFAKYNGKAGTSTALHPLTGETLALVSSPSFEPNEYMFMTPSERQELADEKSEPLLNRFVYPHTPGSVVKPFTAAIGLEAGIINPDATRDIKTKQWQKDNSWGGYHITRVTDPGRPVNLKDALVLSDNIYFAQTAIEMGANSLISGFEKYGFGEEIPYTYPLQSSKISNDGSIGSEILLADTSYGQGQLQMNIVHLAAGFTAFVNDGSMIKPILLAEEETSQVWKEGMIAKQSADLIAANLKAVISDPNGTGKLAQIPGVPLAGKTGTAEVAKTEQGGEGIENGWFVAYNTESPELLIVMTIEDVQEGSSEVVRAVKEVFESRFN